ncbi:MULTISPECIES: hypothetical protein [Propionispora]|uniref:Uncharacterized protein n=2 Tax=Propionispora TaxID=112902 RepID=A0A1H8R4P4_9FIRM|nr:MULTISPECIES: hypothetical protein [Propionispora]SEO61118.1 hypothetical protein SAMN04490178_103158 [Propionispora vibrioides]SHJ35226.1 hypothetical protein SAMN02745170_02340 [Propionispora hippei DSM 15287]
MKTGLEIVRLHREYEEKIHEITNALSKLDEYTYTKTILQEQHDRLRDELKRLEDTRFQPMDPIVIHTSLLGGKSPG